MKEKLKHFYIKKKKSFRDHRMNEVIVYDNLMSNSLRANSFINQFAAYQDEDNDFSKDEGYVTN